MKGIFAFLFVCLISVSAVAGSYRAALVADIDSGVVLYKENADELNYPASLTKIMTLYLTFNALDKERLHLDDYLIVSQAAANELPVKLGLVAGSKISVEDAIKAVAVLSANDVARVLAENLKGGKEETFADLMTHVAKQIGLSQTNFENSSGLPNDDQLSTARDIAMLSMALYKHFPQYWKYFGIKTWTYNGKTYTNGNRLLGVYPGCDGMKTGYTQKSKYSLVATARQNGHHLIAVVLGAANKDVRAATATNMLNMGFDMIAKGSAPIMKKTPVSPVVHTAPTIGATYAAVTAKAQPKTAVSTSGTSGVQFGAFGSEAAARIQVTKIKNKLGVNCAIEVAPNGMYRVRTKGLSEAIAQKLKQSASAAGIDSFVFH